MQAACATVMSLLMLGAAPARATTSSAAPPGRAKVRVAVIGGMTMAGLWRQVSDRFEKQTGYTVVVVATGQRPMLAKALQQGQVDLLTMHSGDITTNLVAAGYGVNLRPWTHNELVIVGPPSDPAKVRGLHHGVEAFRRIAATKAHFVDFHGIGSREVCHRLWKQAHVRPRGDWYLKDESDGHLGILHYAAQHNAYVVVGRMPVVFGKLPRAGMEILVDNDPNMRRPYVVMEADPARFPRANTVGARALSAFLLSDKVQRFLAESPGNRRQGVPVFWPVRAKTAAARSPRWTAVYGTGARPFAVATGSPGELGLLETLAAEFTKDHDVRVRWRKAGSGKSLQLLHDRQVDCAMVHAAAAEKEAVREGWATHRTLLGCNEFVIVGPTSDPAGIRKAKTVVEAYRRIAAARATFFSRADNSGTHKKELAIWDKAGIVPTGGWYVRTHDFMLATLLRAGKENGYFMSDSSTWVVGKGRTPGLRLLFSGDRFIVNVYHALCPPRGATPGADIAPTFADFLASDKAQAIIRAYGKDRYGEPLYRDAQHAKPFE